MFRFDIINILLLILSIISLIVGILNYKQTTWGRWVIIVSLVSILVITGIYIYKYFFSKSRIYQNNSLIFTYPVFYDEREKNVFLMNSKSMMKENLIKYLENNFNITLFYFIVENDDLMKTIEKYNINISMKDILLEDKSRLFQFKKPLGKLGKIGIPYVFNVYDQNIIIKVSNNINLFSRSYSNLDRYKCFNLYKNVSEKSSCLPQKETIEKIIGSSEFVNETVIGFILNNVFYSSYSGEKYKINGRLNNIFDLGNSVFQYGFFQNPTEKIGYNVMEICDNTLDNLFANKSYDDSDFSRIILKIDDKIYTSKTNETAITMMILQQINVLLMILKKLFSFNHGDLKGGNIFYKIDTQYLETDYPLDGFDLFNNTNSSISNTSNLKCRTNIRIKIADYGKASITYMKNHFYCNDTKLKFSANRFTEFDIDPTKKTIETFSPIEGGKYLFDSNLPLFGIDLSLRHMACPYFLSADYYILLTSLSLTSNYFDSFLRTNKIYDLLDVEFDRVSKKPESVVSAIKKLKGKYLKCSAIEDSYNFCLTQLKNF